MKLLIGGAAAAAAIIFTPIAHADGNTANLDQIVGSAYTDFQQHCTRTLAPQFQRIVWNNPPTGQGGAGTIVDANRALGGSFTVSWSPDNSRTPDAQRIVPAQPQGYWDIAFQFC
ncbi:MAG TPA: hypothetical protein VH084_06885 [Mycobacterium sp.]|jgi:hypothetical protein|nr:hypothetical protein [Mycobacterium sp.]